MVHEYVYLLAASYSKMYRKYRFGLASSSHDGLFSQSILILQLNTRELETYYSNHDLMALFSFGIQQKMGAVQLHIA